MQMKIFSNDGYLAFNVAIFSTNFSSFTSIDKVSSLASTSVDSREEIKLDTLTDPPDMTETNTFENLVSLIINLESLALRSVIP